MKSNENNKESEKEEESSSLFSNEVKVS